MLTQEQQILEQIKKAENILVTFSKAWDGDSVASALAMYLVLVKMEKKVDIAAEKFDHSNLYSFLPAYKKITNELSSLKKFIISLKTSRTKVEQVKYVLEDDELKFIISPKNGFFSHDDIKSGSSGYKYDLIIVVDAPDLESLGKIYEDDTELFYKVPIINIDHHPNNEEFGQINFVDLTSVSTTEIIFSLLAEYSRDFIDEKIATCLLAGIISKTKSFKTQNITPKALSVSAQLVSMGANREEIVNNFYRSRSLGVLKLWGRILARLNSDLDNKLIWSALTLLDFEKTGAREEDVREVIDELIINIPQAQAIVIFFEAKKKDEDQIFTKAIIYSTKNINSVDLAKEWDAEGSKNLARIITDKSIQETESEVITSIKNKMDKLPL